MIQGGMSRAAAALSAAGLLLVAACASETGADAASTGDVATTSDVSAAFDAASTEDLPLAEDPDVPVPEDVMPVMDAVDSEDVWTSSDVLAPNDVVETDAVEPVDVEEPTDSVDTDAVDPVDVEEPSDSIETDATVSDTDTSPIDPLPGPAVSAAIAQVVSGETGVAIEGAWVTTVIVGSEYFGDCFTVQAEPQGPALLIQAAPEGVAVGDAVAFTVVATSTETWDTLIATEISGFTVLSSGHDVEVLTQDLSAATDPVASVASYSAERVRLSGALLADMSASEGPISAPVETVGFDGGDEESGRLVVAVSNATPEDVMAFTVGCVVTLEGGFVLPWYGSAYVVVPSLAGLAIGACPSPTIVSVEATAATTIVVTASRPFDPDSVSPAAFAVSGGVSVLDAAASGPTVTLTTSPQLENQTLTLTILPTVVDVSGATFAPADATSDFQSYTAPAELLIAEVNGRLNDFCGLVELYAVTGGKLGSLRVRAHANISRLLPDVMVGAGDLVVLHLGGPTCQPSGAVDELMAKDELPASEIPGNYDSAWDVYLTAGQLPSGDLVLYLEQDDGSIMDAVVTTNDDATASAGLFDDTAALFADAAWLSPTGETLVGSAEDATAFNGYAANGFVGTTVELESVQRTSLNDTNTRADWTTALGTFGALNAGFAP
jgi:hypothetical protein